MFDWPHAPPHRFASHGTYFVTAGTYLKRHHYRRHGDLKRFSGLLFALAREHSIFLQAWCVFSNHYHLVGQGEGSSLRAMLHDLHGRASREQNEQDSAPGRQVWFQYRDTELTFERSWLARLKYTHENAVKHGLVQRAADYPWCSARWLEQAGSPSFQRTLQRLRLDRIQIADDFDVERESE